MIFAAKIPFSTSFFLFPSFLLFSLDALRIDSSADWLSEHFPGHSSFSRRRSSLALEFPCFQGFIGFFLVSRTAEFARMLFSTFLTVAKNPFLKLLQNESKLLLGPVHQGKFLSKSARKQALFFKTLF